MKSLTHKMTEVVTHLLVLSHRSLLHSLCIWEISTATNSHKRLIINKNFKMVGVIHILIEVG